MLHSDNTQVIEAANKLKGIVKYGVGIDAIDIPAAAAKGIPVVNIPEYAEETVAEGALLCSSRLQRNCRQFKIKWKIMVGMARAKMAWI